MFMRTRRGSAFTALAFVPPCAVLLVATTGTAALGIGRVPASSAANWGNAEEVPATATLNTGGYASVYALSCASLGSCSAGGTYANVTNGKVRRQAFVANETNGTWGKAVEVPGTAVLNTGGDARITSFSCASAGNCSAGGSYKDGSSHFQALVVNEIKGVLGTAHELPGTAVLNGGGDASVRGLSCRAPGYCSAGGYYTDHSGHRQAFVANEINGTWGNALEIPGTPALNAGGDGSVESISCASAGNCSAGGFYKDRSSHFQAFIENEIKGIWGTAHEVAGTAALNAGGSGSVRDLSCASAGNCSAGGYYTDHSSHRQSFVVNETNGTWGNALEIPGTAALNAGGDARITSFSCVSAGNCSAGGFYKDGSTHFQAFVANEIKSVWGTAHEVPGTPALNAGGNASVRDLSCASAGNCSAGGYYTDHSSHRQSFVVNETNGTWGNALEIPGTAALNAGGDDTVESLSCAPAGTCSAGGFYKNSSGNTEAFVVN